MTIKQFFSIIIIISFYGFTACENKNDQKPETNTPDSVVNVDSVEESPSEEPEPLDFSWVSKSKITCPEGKCFGALSAMFVRPHKFSKKTSNHSCVATLIEDNKVVTSASCIPEDVRNGESRCNDRLVFRFPEIPGRSPAINVHCDSIEQTAHADVSDDEIRDLRASISIIRLSQSVNRTVAKTGHELTNYGPNPEVQVGALNIDPKSLPRPRPSDYHALDKIEWILDVKSCSVIQNEHSSKALKALPLDCDFGALAGAPVFSKITGHRNLALNLSGIVGATKLTRSSTPFGVRSFHSLSTHLVFGWSLDCLDSSEDCRYKTDELVYGENKSVDQDIIDSFENHSMSDFEGAHSDRHPLSHVLKWRWARNLKDEVFGPDGSILTSAIRVHYFGPYGFVETPERFAIKAINYEGYEASFPVPSCYTTKDPNEWAHAISSMEGASPSLLDEIKRSVEIRNDKFPKIKTSASFDTLYSYLPTAETKQYKDIGSSYSFRDRKYQVGVDLNPELKKEYSSFIELTFSSDEWAFDLTYYRDPIEFVVFVPPCDGAK